MKTELKTPLKIKGCGDVDSLFDAEGNYMADVTDLPFMLEVVRRVNAFDEIVEALAFYMAICGNTAYSTTRESAMEAYEMGQKALEKARTK